MKKIYAVRKGRIPGIYGKWKDCENQVSGYPKAEFKAFEYQDDSDYEAVRKLAQDYIDGKRELRDINMEFNARYIKGGDMPERSSCPM